MGSPWDPQQHLWPQDDDTGQDAADPARAWRPGRHKGRPSAPRPSAQARQVTDPSPGAWPRAALPQVPSVEPSVRTSSDGAWGSQQFCLTAAH